MTFNKNNSLKSACLKKNRMELFDAYIEAMAFSLILILSYLFSYISMKTKVPSILLLIGLGVGAQALIVKYEIDLTLYINEVINLLGIVGLIIIILEATLELKIKKDIKSNINYCNL